MSPEDPVLDALWRVMEKAPKEQRGMVARAVAASTYPDGEAIVRADAEARVARGQSPDAALRAAFASLIERKVAEGVLWVEDQRGAQGFGIAWLAALLPAAAKITEQSNVTVNMALCTLKGDKRFCPGYTASLTAQTEQQRIKADLEMAKMRQDILKVAVPAAIVGGVLLLSLLGIGLATRRPAASAGGAA